MKEHNCRVCGLDIEDKSWGEDERCPTYEVCLCCGVEFGNEDYTIESTKEYRKQWIKKGCLWFNSKKKPENWNFEEQMLDIPVEYK